MADDEDGRPTTTGRPSSVAMIDVPATGTVCERPGSVAFADMKSSASRGGAAPFTPARGDAVSGPSIPGTAGSVLLMDEPKGRKSRPRTVTHSEEVQYQKFEYEPAAHEAEVLDMREQLLLDERDDDLALEKQVKERLQIELKKTSEKHIASQRSAGKELVHQGQMPEQGAPAARVGTGESKSKPGTAFKPGTAGKPGTARESRSRGRSQQRPRGLPGTIGILWKEAYRPVVAPTTADNGYRHVLTVHAIVSGGAADVTGRVKLGDKLIAVQDADQLNRKVVVGMRKDDIRKALHGESGIAISLELLRAVDMGAKKAFLVNIVRTPKLKNEGGTKLPQIGNKQVMPKTPSIKQTGWARGVRLQGNMAPGDGDLKEYHSLSEEEGGGERGDLSADEATQTEDTLLKEQKRLKELKKLKVSDKLTRKEHEQLEVMKKHKEQLDEEADRHAKREVYLRDSIANCEQQLLEARELFCDIARRATGNSLDAPRCTHKNHGAVHSLQSCMQEFRPIMYAFLTKIEEAPAFLPPAIAEERAKEEEEAQVTKETARELRDMKAALQDAEEREERRKAEMAAEIEALMAKYGEEKDEIKKRTDEEIAQLLIKIEMRDKEIEALKQQCEDMRDELDSVVELKDVEEIKMRLLEAEMEGGDSDENQIKKVEVLKLACRAAGLNQDALQEALKDAAVRAQIEVLKKHEAELEAEVWHHFVCVHGWIGGCGGWNCFLCVHMEEFCIKHTHPHSRSLAAHSPSPSAGGTAARGRGQAA